MLDRIRKVVAGVRLTAGLVWLAVQGTIDNIRNSPRDEVEFGHIVVGGPAVTSGGSIDPDVLADLRDRGVKDPERAAAAWARSQRNRELAAEANRRAKEKGSAS